MTTTRETADHIGEANEKVVQTPMHRDAAKAALALRTADHAELAACPFCGGEPNVSTYQTESLWSHDQVTYTRIGCDECDVAFRKEPGHEPQADEAWNARPREAALLSEIAALRGEVSSLEIRRDFFKHNMIQAERQRDELRKALEPFVVEAERIRAPYSAETIMDNVELWQCGSVEITRTRLTYGDLRRALLANQGADHD